ncbi:MAG: hypothetical protein ACR2G6_10855 [Gemmatimonadaceae bacterium]
MPVRIRHTRASLLLGRSRPYLRSATFRNFWSLNFTAWHDFRGMNGRLTRGGPLMATGYNNVGIIALTNSFAANTRWQARVYYGKG